MLALQKKPSINTSKLPPWSVAKQNSSSVTERCTSAIISSDEGLVVWQPLSKPLLGIDISPYIHVAP